MGNRRLERISSIGDPVLRRGDGCTAYHLAVCVDDFDQGVTHVVRGRDLLAFSHLHAHLHDLLGNSCHPAFLHHALLGDADGSRMAKRIGSTSLAGMRQAGMDARVLIGGLANILFPGTIKDSTPCSARDLIAFGLPTPTTIDQPFSLPSLESP
mgnify:FL=1